MKKRKRVEVVEEEVEVAPDDLDDEEQEPDVQHHLVARLHGGEDESDEEGRVEQVDEDLVGAEHGQESHDRKAGKHGVVPRRAPGVSALEVGGVGEGGQGDDGQPRKEPAEADGLHPIAVCEGRDEAQEEDSGCASDLEDDAEARPFCGVMQPP